MSRPPTWRAPARLWSKCFTWRQHDRPSADVTDISLASTAEKTPRFKLVQGLVETGGGANGDAGRAQLGVAVDLRRAEFTARDFELEAAMPARAVKREGLERPASGM
jgi:hypothetical protein